MGLADWVRGQNLLAPVWLATYAAVVAMYASGIFALIRYAPAAQGVVTRATVVNMTDSDYRRCGRDQYPEVIVTFRPANRADAGPTFTDQMCLFDVRVGDTVTVARQANGDVYVDPISSIAGVLARVAGWTAAVWLAVFGATTARNRLDAMANLRETRRNSRPPTRSG
jgi:hypothetical protein